MTVNGRTYEFAAMQIIGAGVTIESLESAEYGAGRDVEIYTNTAGSPLHWSLGRFSDDDVTLEFAKTDLAEFLGGIEDAPGGGKLGGRFTCTITYADTDQPETTDTLDLILTRVRDAVRRDRPTMSTITAKHAAPPILGDIELMPVASGGGGSSPSGGSPTRFDPGGFPI